MNLARTIRRFAEPLTIVRRDGCWEAGRFVTTSQEIPTRGVAQPAGKTELEKLPEADRVTGMMAFYTLDPLRLTTTDGLSDEILWRGQTYSLIQIEHWERYGFSLAIGVKKEGVDNVNLIGAGGNPAPPYC